MQWVRQNAAAFNGDPTRLTIFGESAGAGSISVHLVAPRSEGHFDRAIIESSAPNAPWVAMPLVVAEQRFATLASAAGCSSAGAGPAVVACLRAKNSTELYHHKPSGPWLDEWAPVIDGVEVTGQPALLTEQGKVHDVPVMLGTNLDEGTLFVPTKSNASDQDFAYWINKTFSSHDAALLTSVYSPSKYNATKDASRAFWALAAILGDGLMTCPARRSAHLLAHTPGRKSNTFRYFFQHELSLLKTIEDVGKSHAYGVCHGSELALVFHLDALLGLDAERSMSKQVVKWWETFAATGMPGATAAEWPPSGMLLTRSPHLFVFLSSKLFFFFLFFFSPDVCISDAGWHTSKVQLHLQTVPWSGTLQKMGYLTSQSTLLSFPFCWNLECVGGF